MLRLERQIWVEWGDCDPARIVFYPRYFAWFDASTHLMLEDAGIGHDVLREQYGVRGCVLGAVEASFSSPGFYADRLSLHAQVVRVGGASFSVQHTISRGAEQLLSGQETRIWAVEDATRPAGIRAERIPDTVRALLNGQIGSGEA